MGEASKSMQEASKTALEASKNAAGVSKNTFDDLTYVGKSTIGDLTKTAKEAAAKKGLLKVDMNLDLHSRPLSLRRCLFFFHLQGLGDSQSSPEAPGPGMMPRKDSNSTQLVAPDSRSGRREIGRDFFSNISSDLNGIAAQTSSMFSDLFSKT